MGFSFFRKKQQDSNESRKDPTPPPDGEIRSETDTAVERSPASAENTAAQGDPAPSAGLLKRLKDGLAKTRKTFSSGLDKIFSGKKEIDDALLESLEELLITADVGVQTTLTLMDRVSKQSDKIADAEKLRQLLKKEILAFLGESAPLPATPEKPKVVMIVGVNGVGKTTTIGKLAATFASEGKRVLIAAADTFRAAAIEQLSIWAQRAGADIVKHKPDADPSAVAFDALEAAVARNADVVLIDTAGRLHTRVNLMEELKKMKRTLAKRLPGAPHEVLLVLDATTGQNAISQAKLFHEALHITGIALTKLDGTAKGGIVISICHSLNIPLRYIGVGEKIEDLQPFDPKHFVEALF